MSIHILDSAKFAKTVLMPGDPLRAKYIADNYLTDVKEVTNVRGILGFTGKTKTGKEISVMASGMGCPSIGIYSYELFKFYGVENIIRIGTCGSLSDDCHVGDVILGTSACSNGGFASQYAVNDIRMSPVADFGLLYKSYNNAKKLGLSVHVGPVVSSDCFYGEDTSQNERLSNMGIIGCEMEAYALFLNAMMLKKHAACILTVSDKLVGKKEKDLTQIERQTMLHNMFNLALSWVD